MAPVTVTPDRTIVAAPGVVSPALLTPSSVEAMLRRRVDSQLPKFRTTCTDCVPNF